MCMWTGACFVEPCNVHFTVILTCENSARFNPNYFVVHVRDVTYYELKERNLKIAIIV
jgi:hypothetical protein